VSQYQTVGRAMSAVYEITGITEADFRDWCPLPNRDAWEVRARNHRRYIVTGYDLTRWHARTWR
jgi:hypothetical protein